MKSSEHLINKEVKEKWTAFLNSKIFTSHGGGDAEYGKEHQEGKRRHDLFDATIRLTLNRLITAEQNKKNRTHPSAIPFIVCCLKTLDMPELRAGGKNHYLSILYQNEELRKRTVIILDADFLRKSHRRPVGISSEASWEGTALDTVEAFQRREHLQPYLDFGFLVIRYGVTGALIISRQPDGELFVRLLFDPNKNDRSWSRENAGEVLGHTSIFAASIVQAITNRCEDRDHDPQLGDIIEILLHSLRNALLRCQRTCSYAYGPVQTKADWQVKAFDDLVNKNNGVLRNLYERQYRPPMGAKSLLFRHLPEPGSFLNVEQIAEYNADSKNMSDAAAQWVSMSKIPKFDSYRWSILEESCYSNMEDVAYDIANTGVDEVLNVTKTTKDDELSNVNFEVLNGLVSPLESFLDKAIAYYETIKNIEAVENSTKKLNDAHEEWKNKLLNEAKKTLTESLIPTAEKANSHPGSDQDTLPQATKHAIRENVNDCVEKIMNQYKSFLESTEFTNYAENKSSAKYEPMMRAFRSTFKEIFSLLKSKDIFAKSTDYIMTQYSAPIARFGKGGKKIVVIDRRDIEGIAAIQRLVANYATKNFGQSKARPLSIAVFGPPGSGKSTAVKAIAREHEQKITFDNLEFNLSQFTNVEKLSEAFRQCDEEHKKTGKIPLVFFDEFDSKFEQTDFGWLKYFLAPMEDGRFGGSLVGPAIFVFAGGTSYSFNDFSPAKPSPSDQRWIDFSRAKGPDFISRLSGHLNVIGIDPTDPDDGLYLLRRAVLIRAFLEDKGAVDKNGKSMVDDERVLRAILHAPSYRYGGRSLRMLIEACLGSDGWIRRCNIPATHELDMMVDSKSFHATLRDSYGESFV